MTHIDFSATTKETTQKTSSTSKIYERIGKRYFDFFMAIFLIPVVFPAVIVLAMINFLTSGSMFFGHKRIGRNGRVFTCWKLQTMLPNSDEILTAYLKSNPEAAQEWADKQKLTDDPRVTSFGRFLRKTSLDELPQLWNVLMGHMSFVGPRPIIQNELSYYGAARSKYLSLRPGVTGIWQVYGRSNGCYIERVSMDRAYCDAISILQDVKLIFLTAFVIFLPTGR